MSKKNEYKISQVTVKFVQLFSNNKSVITVWVCSYLKQWGLVELFEIFLCEAFSTNWAGEILCTPRVDTLFVKDMITWGSSDILAVSQCDQTYDTLLLIILILDGNFCILCVLLPEWFRRHVFIKEFDIIFHSVTGIEYFSQTQP